MTVIDITEPAVVEAAPRQANRRLRDVEWLTPLDVLTGEPARESAPSPAPSPALDELAEAWCRYKADGDDRARDTLIAAYLPFVRAIAAKVRLRLPKSIEGGDLISYGTLGLLEAIERFEPERGLKFETYALLRIRGAILDELRAWDWLPRSIRTRIRELERTSARLEKEQSRAPTEAELADELEVTVAQVDELLAHAQAARFVSVEEMVQGAGRESVVLAAKEADPADTLDPAATRAGLAELLATMTEREKVVVALYYLESMALRDIGQVLGISESRVCQIHTRAIRKLRRTMSAIDRFESVTTGPWAPAA